MHVEMAYPPITGLVSVIIPTAGNRLPDLKRAIESVLSQTYPKVETIVISDGVDTPLAIIKEFVDERVHFIQAPKCADPGILRNLGVSRCSGEYVAFLDDDDMFFPNHLETLLSETTIDTIPFSRALYVFKRPGQEDELTTNIEPNNPRAPYYDPKAIFEQNIAPLSSFLIKRQMHEEIGGFDTNLIRLEDWDYWGRMSIKFSLNFIDVITSKITIDLATPSRSFREDLFKNANALVGERIKERLKLLAAKKQAIIDDTINKVCPIPLVSVIMPVYNASSYLREAVDSILNQTFICFELIAINDGSTDDSGKILDSYSTDKRVRVFHRKNYGITKTLNFALGQALGKYIARMDSDDVAHPDRLSLQVAYLQQHSDTALLGTRFRAIKPSGEFIENLDVELTNEELQPALLQSCRFGHPTVMITRWAFEGVGGYDESPNIQPAEDYDLWLRIAEKYKVANLPQYLLNYRVHPGSITQSKQEAVKLATRECIRLSLIRRGITSPQIDARPSQSALLNLRDFIRRIVKR